jgi:putative transcriptional regulator
MEVEFNMRPEELRSCTGRILDNAGYVYSEISSDRSFEFVARRDNSLILVRTLGPRADMERAVANDLKSLSGVLKASPLLVVASSRGSRYHDGVLYLRFGIPLITVGTLREHLIDGIPPMIFFGPGGHYVSLDRDRLRTRREELGMSLGALADMVGVSRRAIQMYEGGMGADLEVAIKLEKALTTSLISPLDPFSRSEQLESIREQYDTLDGLKKDVFSIWTPSGWR